LREAVRVLIAEVMGAREVNGAGSRRRPARENPWPSPGKNFPARAQEEDSLLRQFIRPTNDVPAVDKLLADVKSHIKGNPELTKQAVDGWTRILHFGDHYGTDYARKVGREFLESLNHAKDGKPKFE
jgi:hypothetical protein